MFFSIFHTTTFQGITVPREDWYWPKIENEEEEEDCLKDIEEGRNEDEEDFVDLTVCIPLYFCHLSPIYISSYSYFLLCHRK